MNESGTPSGEVITIEQFVNRLSDSLGTVPVSVTIGDGVRAETVRLDSDRFQAVKNKRIFVPYYGLNKATLVDPIFEDEI